MPAGAGRRTGRSRASLCRRMGLGCADWAKAKEAWPACGYGYTNGCRSAPHIQVCTAPSPPVTCAGERTCGRPAAPDAGERRSTGNRVVGQEAGCGRQRWRCCKCRLAAHPGSEPGDGRARQPRPQQRPPRMPAALQPRPHKHNQPRQHSMPPLEPLPPRKPCQPDPPLPLPPPPPTAPTCAACVSPQPHICVCICVCVCLGGVQYMCVGGGGQAKGVRPAGPHLDRVWHAPQRLDAVNVLCEHVEAHAEKRPHHLHRVGAQGHVAAGLPRKALCRRAEQGRAGRTARWAWVWTAAL